MTVESNFAIAIVMLIDWFKNLALVYQPKRTKTKTNRDLHAGSFPRFEQVTWNCYEFSDWFSALFESAVLGRSNYFGIFFYDTY